MCHLTLAAGVDAAALVCRHSLEAARSAHIHVARPGENGPPLVTLGLDFADPFEHVFAPPTELAAHLLAGELYVDIHTASRPHGALRGRLEPLLGAVHGGLCAADAVTLCLGDGRFRVSVDWTSPDTTGRGHAVADTADSGLFWFFSPDNREMLVKIVDGCDANGHFWVFASAATDVALRMTVEDLVAGEVRRYDNPIGEPARPVVDTAAFATCDASPDASPAS